MNRSKGTTFRCVALLLTLSFALQPIALAMPSTTSERLLITVGRPTIWSIEQAHYLLTRMRLKNQGLEGAAPTLNANSINGTMLDLLQSSLTVGGSLDTPAGTTNQLKLDNYQLDLARKEGLIANLSELRDQRRQVLLELGQLQVEKAGVPQTDTARATARDQQIAAKTSEKAILDSDIGSAESDLGKIQLTAPSLTSPDLAKLSGNGPGTQDTFLNNLYAEAKKSSPALDASAALDNHIQLQYELIAKQLTLLRDEIGADERVVFVELPHSFYAVKKKAKDYLVQVRWEVDALCGVRAMEDGAEPPRSVEGENQDPLRVFLTETQQAVRFLAAPPSSGCETGTLSLDSKRARAIELIPRQSALNVNAIHGTVKGFNLLGRLGWLIGFGTKIDYVRQREQYGQFIEQETFASGFGKGESKFGWTFGPRPGSRVIAPGVHTTYAVLSVPRNATQITLRTESIAYHMNKMPTKEREDSKNIQAKDSFPLMIPSADEKKGFYVAGVFYTPVSKGQRTVVFLKGSRFSPQTGVLVNGVALRPSVGLAQPGFAKADPKHSGQKGDVVGEFEHHSQSTMVLSFSIKNFVGTPTIALISPGRAASINRFPLPMNNRETLRKRSLKEPMFVEKLTLTDLKVRSVSPTVVEATLTGEGFRDAATIKVNSVDVTSAQLESATRYFVSFPPPSTTDWDVSISQDLGETQQSVTHSESNPFSLRVSSHEVLGHWPGDSKATPPTKSRLLLKVTGNALCPLPGTATSSLDIEVNGTAVKNPKTKELSDGSLLIDLEPPATDVIVVALTRGKQSDAFKVVLKAKVDEQKKADDNKPKP